MSERARQFLPFDALKGLKEEIRKKEIVKVDKLELAEDAKEVIEYKLQQVRIGMMVEVIYFKNNEYLKVTGLVSKIDIVNHYLEVVKTRIYFNDIHDLNSEDFKDF